MLADTQPNVAQGVHVLVCTDFSCMSSTCAPAVSSLCGVICGFIGGVQLQPQSHVTARAAGAVLPGTWGPQPGGRGQHRQRQEHTA